MKHLEALKPLRELLVQIQHLNSAISLLSWDQETYMPGGAGQARAEQLSALKGLVHEKQVGRTMAKTLAKWVDLETGGLLGNPSDWDEQSQALLREVWRDYHRATRLPADFVRALGLETSLSHQIWIEARKQNDFSRFSPSLKRIIALKKKEAAYLGYENTPYDPLLDMYEPGMTTAKIIPLFDSLKARLVPLVEKIKASPVTPQHTVFQAYFEPASQIHFGEKVLGAMGYDFSMGRQDLSAHPFTTSFHPTDVRITTRVDPEDLLSSLFSSIHEGGHALYEQGLPVDHYGTPLGEPISLGLHESQSRLWENCVGRSLPFWNYFYPHVQETFPERFKGVDLETFYRAVNTVSPSLIRVEADEVTYNLHIMLRFEVERALIEEDLAIEKLPALWNDKMEAYLGIRPETDAEGVLQDVHWSGGAFGYFPTYTLGNLYAAQFFNQANKDLCDLEDKISRGDLLPLKTWLNEKIHRWGRQYSSEQIVRRVCGEAPNPVYFINDLEKKFGEIYGLSL